MSINRRRAPSSAISREKKLGGHLREADYASLIGGLTIAGVQKGDVKDKSGNLHSVKSGKKWQVFLYGYQRILSSSSLNVLKPCLDSFTINAKTYFEDRTKCISFKEGYIEKNGRAKGVSLSNDVVSMALGSNEYIASKYRLAENTLAVKKMLSDKNNLRLFLDEAIFNSGEVAFLGVKDTTYACDNKFKVFHKDDVLEILTMRLFPETSAAGKVPEDFNVAAQKTLLRYKKNGKYKNIVEIEIRNDSEDHYRQVRFNMYSKDTLAILLDASHGLNGKKVHEDLLVYGKAMSILKF